MRSLPKGCRPDILSAGVGLFSLLGAVGPEWADQARAARGPVWSLGLPSWWGGRGGWTPNSLGPDRLPPLSGQRSAPGRGPAGFPGGGQEGEWRGGMGGEGLPGGEGAPGLARPAGGLVVGPCWGPCCVVTPIPQMSQPSDACFHT